MSDYVKWLNTFNGTKWNPYTRDEVKYKIIIIRSTAHALDWEKGGVKLFNN